MTAFLIALAAAWSLKPGHTSMLDGQARRLQEGDQDEAPFDSDSGRRQIEAKLSPEKPGSNGKQEATITLTIDQGWHLYANPVGNDDLKSVQTEVSVTAKKKLEATKVAYPDGKEVNDAVLGKYSVFEGKATITATVWRSAGDDSPLEVKIKLQACNDSQCLLPATKTLTLP